MQGAFDTRVWMFNRVVLRTNFGKTVRMVYHTCQTAGTQLEVEYKLLMTEERLSYR